MRIQEQFWQNDFGVETEVIRPEDIITFGSPMEEEWIPEEHGFEPIGK